MALPTVAVELEGSHGDIDTALNYYLDPALGGHSSFEAGTAALRRWDQFRLGWVEAAPSDTPIKLGQMVAVVANVEGLWWLNACKIVAVIETPTAAPTLRTRLSRLDPDVRYCGGKVE